MPSTSFIAATANSTLELFAPTRCVVCEKPGQLLCDECRSKLPWISQQWACPNCGAPYGKLVCSECADKKKRPVQWESRAVICAMGFKGPPARLILTLKDGHELRLAPVIAAAILCALEEASAWKARDGSSRFDSSMIDGVSFIPATAEAYARRGFDHMELVAQSFCQIAGLPLYDVLVRPHAKDQRTLSSVQRHINLKGSIACTTPVNQSNILLLDDVVTTGASMREATRVLCAAGVHSVTVGALARVW